MRSKRRRGRNKFMNENSGKEGKVAINRPGKAASAAFTKRWEAS
jgi:hypothetical protein